MNLQWVGETFLSGSIATLIDRLASVEVLNFLRGKSKPSCDFVELVGKLKLVLNSMAAVLDDAEQKQIRNRPGVDAWLDELQDAVYDADDILDEIEYDALQLKVEQAESEGSTSKVSNLPKKRKWFTDLFSSSQSSNVGDMENKINKILERFKLVEEQKDSLDLKEGTLGEKTSWRIPSTCLPDEPEVYGRDDDKDVVRKLLLSNDNFSKEIGVIPIVGMGGVGKTTLAQELFNDDEVGRHFELKEWVCVSEEYDVCKVTKAILGTTHNSNVTELNSLQVELRTRLMGKKFLIVLDDVWNDNYNDWKDLKKPFMAGAQGSKIIVTTRIEKVASIMGTVHPHHLKQLTDDDCWQLLAKHASSALTGDISINSDFEIVGREIAKKCGGLPLAAKTLGGLLRLMSNVEEWERIANSDIWELKDDILPALKLSYYSLPSHLKRCFAYCSIFPKDYLFQKEELVLLWMAENLLECSKKNRRMEEVGDEYFNDLVSRSLFQRRSHYFVMHDLTVDLAKFVSKKTYFLERGNYSDETILNQARHFGYDQMKLRDHEQIFKLVSEATCLRTFVPLNGFGLSFPGSTKQLVHALRNLRCLRYLSLRNYRDLKQLPESIGELRHLRYLNLSNTSIELLPESLSMLYNLQTLMLSCCKCLTKLPKDLHRLINLRYLDIEGSGVIEMPTQLSKLKSLQKLSAFVVGKDSGAKIGQLGKFPDLSGRLAIYNLQNVVKANDDASRAKLSDKKHIEELQLRWDDKTNASEHERDVLENLLPNTKLKKLEIENYGGTTFSKWLGNQSYCNLVDVALHNCKFCCTLPPLGELPSLKSLSIRNLDALVKVGPEFYGSSSVKPFASLESLSFERMSNWKEWLMPIEDVEAFPKLRQLSLFICESLFGNLPCLFPSLTCISIRRCPELASSLPRMPIVNILELESCSKLMGFEVIESFSFLEILDISFYFNPITFRCLPATLKSLLISDCKNLEFPLEYLYESLQMLSIKGYSSSSTRSFPLDSFPNIRYLSIGDCENLESLSLSEGPKYLSYLYIGRCPNFTLSPNSNLNFPILTELEFKDCEKLQLLPEQLHILLPSLQCLKITNCPDLESFPTSMLPFSLRELKIVNCDKFVASRKNWKLQELPLLTSFIIHKYGLEDVEFFPEQGLLPTTITDLKILELTCLKTLDEKGFEELTSLKRLFIADCPNLQTLPKEGLPTSLEQLSISSCPLLEGKCEREKGEYWDKIARIPSFDNEIYDWELLL